MAKKLLIVESPAKAKTIEKYLDGEFKVKSSFGHVRDLEKGNKGIDIENEFEPSYVVSPEKEKVVNELKSLAKKSEEVWLATDEDREGEAISWHLCKVLGLDEDKTKRIVFREITKPAIQKAIQNPRNVDIDLVNAQQARRILDRLVGFELSGILWRKIRTKLSAGRVQSVAVKLIVDREQEIREFSRTPYFKITSLFNVESNNGNKVELKADLAKKIEVLGDARSFLENCKEATFSIDDIVVRPTKRKPTAPFITSTLQQDASRKLGFGVKRTMMIAQRLYEQGLITYMRTDSVSLSETAISSIAEEIKSKYGDKYLETRRYKTKKKDAQEAHEAIRPTYIDRPSAGADVDQQKLYELIWKRTIASQMADAQLEKTTVKIGISTIPDQQLKADGEVMIFDGFLKVYMESKDDDDNGEAKGILPPLKVGQTLDLKSMNALERFTRGPARFTEASLVKKLEELGIGRPSTYAPTISRIMEASRGYVTKESREGVERLFKSITLESGEIKEEEQSEITGATSKRLYASDLGIIVTDFLTQHFAEIMEYNFTADIEKKFDVIAEGDIEWKNMIKEFYTPFHKVVETTLAEAERAKGRRDLGVDPATGHTVLAQMTRFGPAVQIGTVEEVGEEGKPRFASLRVGQSLQSITYEDAMELFKLPKSVGEYESEDVVVNVGRFGPYVKFKEAFISIPRDEDPMEITLERCIELIEEKKKADAPIGFYDGKPYTKGKGRFGPYLKWEGKFVNIPRRFDPETLTEQEAHELIAIKIEKDAKKFIHVWEEEKINVENGRWGPYIKFKKKNVKIPKKEDGTRITYEEAQAMTLDDVKAIILAEDPTAFGKPKKKKAAAKKKTTKKPAAKKKTTKKAADKK